MITTRTEILNNRNFIVTTSDSGFMISRDGALYSEAWDLEGTDRVYEETDIPIEGNEPELTLPKTKSNTRRSS